MTRLWLYAGIHVKTNSISYMTNELCDVSKMKQMVKNYWLCDLYVMPRNRNVHISDWHTLKFGIEF